MKQGSYKLEIIGELIKGKIHLRELARKLKINPMTLSRKMKELLDENVVDFNQEGKNKVYFLKKNTESKAYVLMAEQYKLGEVLRKYPSLRIIFEKLEEDLRISLAVLFGSYAKGNPKKESDIDIYIETQNRKIKTELEELNSKLSVKIGKYNKDNLLIKEIEKNHVIIKGVEKFYENCKFFRKN